MSVKRHVVLYDDSAAGSGTWFALDTKYESDSSRTVQINMNASDTIALQGTTIEAKDAADLGTVAAEDITTIQSYTGNTDENDALIGSFTFIRVTKTGTAGNAKVQGVI